jgi:nucleoid DNA-binding protein
MTFGELVIEVADQAKVTMEAAERCLKEAVSEISAALARADEVRLRERLNP